MKFAIEHFASLVGGDEFSPGACSLLQLVVLFCVSYLAFMLSDLTWLSVCELRG